MKYLEYGFDLFFASIIKDLYIDIFIEIWLSINFMIIEEAITHNIPIINQFQLNRCFLNWIEFFDMRVFGFNVIVPWRPDKFERFFTCFLYHIFPEFTINLQ